MDTQDLNIFIAVAECGSFSEAAEKVYLSQPAVSKRISNLENQLDTRLFDRISRQVFLTEAGKILLPKAKSVLQEIESTKQLLHSLRGEISGKLSIAISHHLGLHRLPPILKTFSEAFPEVDLDVSFNDSEKAYEGVLHGSFELAVNTLAPSTVDKVNEIYLWTDKMKFVCTKNHPLADIPSPTLEDLAKHRCLIPDTTTFTGRLLEQAFVKQSLQLKPIMSTNFLQTLGKMTEIGLGWSLLPETLIEPGSMSEIPIDLPLERKLGIIHHAERTLSSAALAFIETCTQSASTH